MVGKTGNACKNKSEIAKSVKDFSLFPWLSSFYIRSKPAVFVFCSI